METKNTSPNSLPDNNRQPQQHHPATIPALAYLCEVAIGFSGLQIIRKSALEAAAKTNGDKLAATIANTLSQLFDGGEPSDVDLIGLAFVIMDVDRQLKAGLL